MADHHQQSSLVTSFVLSNQQKVYLEALTLLAGLQFPVADMETFTRQLEGEGNTAHESDEKATTLLHTTFGSLDFPIQSPRGAMEKFHAKITQSDIPTRLSLPDALPPGPIEQPRNNPLPWYIRLFGPRCGREAFDVYLAVLSTANPYDPFGQLRAELAGWSRGRRCQMGVSS